MKIPIDILQYHEKFQSSEVGKIVLEIKWLIAKHSEGSVENEHDFVLKIIYFDLLDTHYLCLKIFYISYENPGIYSAVHHICTQF